MSHEHHHHHHHAVDTSHLNRAFIVGIGLNVAFVVAEAVAGFSIDSLGLLADAGHNLSDVISLVLALLAFRLSKVRPSGNYTYGYKKSTILVSLLNALILLIAVGFIFVESIEKIHTPQPIAGRTISIVAGIGILINGITAWLFFKDRRHDLNIKGAFLHMAADTLVSVGVLVSGILISVTGWSIIDPIIGLVIACIILISTWELLRDSLRLSLDGVPAHLHTSVVERLLCEDKRVVCVHHLHIWAISTTQNALTAHIVVNTFDKSDILKHDLRHRLEEIGIQHATFELELPHEDCHASRCDCDA
ncbi:MAG: cation transporter [Coprobacter sp.]|nr:cation transporter [Coprobacter sp.]